MAREGLRPGEPVPGNTSVPTDPQAGKVGPAQEVAGPWIALLGGGPIEAGGPPGALPHPPALGVADSELTLGLGIAKAGRTSQPPHGGPLSWISFAPVAKQPR